MKKVVISIVVAAALLVGVVLGVVHTTPSDIEVAVKALTEAEAMLGKWDYEKNDYYTLTDYTKDFDIITKDIALDSITKNNGFSDLAVWRRGTKETLQDYYRLVTESARIKYRQQDLYADTLLFFWGEVEDLMNPKVQASSIEMLFNQFGITSHMHPVFLDIHRLEVKALSEELDRVREQWRKAVGWDELGEEEQRRLSIELLRGIPDEIWRSRDYIKMLEATIRQYNYELEGA